MAALTVNLKPDRAKMFDILIKDATVVDGTGAKPWVGDVAIDNGRFVALEHSIDAESRRVIAARGLVLAPGFIDIHCHSDLSLFDDPAAEIKLRQGVTLEVLGNCGSSLAPLVEKSRDLVQAENRAALDTWNHPLAWSSYAEYARTLEKRGLSINVMGLVGHATLRIAAMEHSDKAPTGQNQPQKDFLSRRETNAAYPRMTMAAGWTGSHMPVVMNSFHPIRAPMGRKPSTPGGRCTVMAPLLNA